MQSPSAPARKSLAPCHELWQRYHQDCGDPVESELIEEYLPLVKTVVGRLAMTLPSQVQADDLISAGLLGLLQAVRNYRSDAGTTFETYARVRIRGAVLDELRRMDWVPRSVHDKARRLQNAMLKQEQILGRAPADEEMARALQISLETYQELLTETKPACFVSLDNVTEHSPGATNSIQALLVNDERNNPDHTAVRREMVSLVEDRLRQLPDMQRKVLALYYYEDMRLREIAEILGVTESRVCQVHAKAILSIKTSLRQYEQTRN